MYKDSFGKPNLLNLPRFIWVSKSWSLAELHHYVFDYIKEMFRLWYQEGGERKANKRPTYKHPDTQEELTKESIEELF